MNRNDWLRGWIAGMVLGAGVGFAGALALSQVDRMAWAPASAPAPPARLTVEVQMRGQRHLGAASSYLKLGNTEVAGQLYARVLGLDCANREASAGLRAALVGAPFERERILQEARRACSSRG